MKKEIIKFLNLANKNTYANKEAQKANSSKLKSEDYIFESGEYLYYDTYWTGKKDVTFIGSEIIYKNKEQIWGANYFGSVLDKNLSVKEIYNFLRESMMQKDDSLIPVRGPNLYKKENWKYSFVAKGDITMFAGVEKIFYKGKLVYKLDINGGVLI
jgi:hypothetical protein